VPSIGQSAIATILAKPYVVEGGFAVQNNVNGTFIQKLAAAVHAGWTSVSPETPTSMSVSFSTEFNNYLFAGIGLQYVNCIASGIDDEVNAWVASWNNVLLVHEYTVNAASIVSRIMACSPITSNGAQIFAEASAEAFMAGFGQEVG